jgi:hypothetical protein
MAYYFATNPFTTYCLSRWRTPVIFRVWDSSSDAKLDGQPNSLWHSGTFTPPNYPPNAVFEIWEALLQHFTYKDYARSWTSFTNSANDAVHHALRLHNRRGGRGVTYISAIRTDLLDGQCSLQSAQDLIEEYGLDLSHYMTDNWRYQHEVLLSGMAKEKALIDTRAFVGSDVATAVRKWIEEELRQHASMALGLGPMNPFAGIGSLWQE